MTAENPWLRGGSGVIRAGALRGGRSAAEETEGAVSKSIRVLIADDHPIFRDGLRRLLEDEGGFEVVGEAADGAQAVSLAQALHPDVLLLDMVMPRVSGLEALRELAAAGEPPRVLLLTAEIDGAQFLEALSLGARGVVLKESATQLLFKAIRTVFEGQYWVGRDAVTDIVRHIREQASLVRPRPVPADRLTQREREIVAGVAVGESNREVAQRLRLSEDTVKHHLTSIFDKVGVSKRAELVAYAMTHGLTEAPLAGRPRAPHES